MASDDEVIPLSRFRAALARARQRRRADALIAEPDAPRLVAALPVQELYHAITEVGLSDGVELLALATPEQVQGLVDLDTWDRDHFSETQLRPWIDAFMESGPERVAAAVQSIDSEVIALYIQRNAHVYDLTIDQPPEEPEGHYFPTPDTFFLLDIVGPGDAGKSVEHFIDWIYRADLELGRRICMSARWEMDSNLEEWAYRWRSGRMADLGYADYYDALAIYRPLEPSAIAETESTQAGASMPPTILPMALAEALDPTAFFGHALATIADEAQLERLHGSLLTLVNKMLAAERAAPGDVVAARTAMVRAVATLSLSLELLSRGQPDAAGQLLGRVAIERLFRVGFGLQRRLVQLTAALRGPRGPWAAGNLRVEGQLADAVLAFAAARPSFPRSGDDPPGDGFRPIGTMADLQRGAALLEEAAVQSAVVRALCGDEPTALERLLDGAAGVVALRFGAVARTFAARVLLGERPDTPLEPLEPRQQREAARAVVDAARIDAAMRARLAAAGLAPPAALDRWIAAWLKDWALTVAREGGIVVRDPLAARRSPPPPPAPVRAPTPAKPAPAKPKPKAAVKAKPKAKLRTKPKARPAAPKAKPKPKAPKPKRHK